MGTKVMPNIAGRDQRGTSVNTESQGQSRAGSKGTVLQACGIMHAGKMAPTIQRGWDCQTQFGTCQKILE